MPKHANLPWSLANKPLVDMTHGEFEMTMDAGFAELDQQILDAARKGDDQEIALVVVVVNTADATRIVMEAVDHGDGESIGNLTELAARLKQWCMLKPEESVEVRVIPMTAEFLIGLPHV